MSDSNEKRTNRGRKGKYTPDVIKRIVDAVRLGCPYKLAAQYGGISHETFYDWIKNKSDFSDQIKNAEAEAVMTRIANIRLAAKNGAWQADAWLLERRHPEEFGRHIQELRGDTVFKLVVEQIPSRADDGNQT